MKLIFAGLFCLLATALQAQMPPPFATPPDAITGMFEWPWDESALCTNHFTSAGGRSPSGNSPNTLLYLSYSGQLPSVYTLRTLGPAIVSRITSRRYAIVGHIKYDNVAVGSFLEMENWFAPEQPGGPEGYYYSRTMADGGPLAKIEGSDDGRDFALPFDATGAKTALVRLVMKVHLAGAGNLEFSNVQLVQYPDSAVTAPNPAATPQSPEKMIVNVKQPEGGSLHIRMAGVDYLTLAAFEVAAKALAQANPKLPFILRTDKGIPYASMAGTLDSLREAGATNVFFANDPSPNGANAPLASDGKSTPLSSSPARLDWRSFGLGVLAAVTVGLGATALFFLAHRFRGLRHARELRRIASLDV
jgi:biopolymer transport protein ExbD